MGWSTIPKVITGVKPLKKIKGAMTKGQVMSKAALAKMKTAGFNLGQTFKESDKLLKKTEEIRKQTEALLKKRK